MTRRFVLVLLVAGFAAATSPVWAADPGNPTFSPDPAYPGQTVSFSGSLPDVGFSPDTCDVTGPDASTPTYACSYDELGAFSGWVVVPSAATIGKSYLLVFCGPVGCATTLKAAWMATNSVAITPSPASSPSDRVVVPTLHCVDYIAGSSRLTAKGLVVGSTPFSGAIGRVVPSGGSVVSSGSTVTPFPPQVPAVTALAVESAGALVRRACGSPSAVGTGNLVLGQSPSPGLTLPVDRRVTLVLNDVTPPPPWWTNLIVWVAGVLLLVLLVVVVVAVWGVRHVRRTARAQRPPDPVLVRAGRIARTFPPDSPGHVPAAPDLVVVRYPTTYWMEEPS
jgi:hypothetical protein